MRFKRRNNSWDLDSEGLQRTYDLDGVFDEHFKEYNYGENGCLEELKYNINLIESLLLELIEIMPEKAKIRLAENLGFELVKEGQEDK